jgi:hypothetical protein
MTGRRTGTQEPTPPIYQIRLQGQLGPQWADWFEGLTLVLTENGETILTGPVADQPALHGLIKKVRDLGMPLLAVTRVELDPPTGGHPSEGE